MENGDKPAYPFNGIEAIDYGGLTKRKRFAIAAMEGLLSGGARIDSVAQESVKLADALLKEFETTKK